LKIRPEGRPLALIEATPTRFPRRRSFSDRIPHPVGPSLAYPRLLQTQDGRDQVLVRGVGGNTLEYPSSRRPRFELVLERVLTAATSG
jgi:hypothetical protein